MQVEAAQSAAAVSLPMLLGIGWVAAVAVLAYGLLKHRPGYSQVGFALTGLMTLLTPLAWYAYALGRPDLYPIGLSDVIILALLAFLGGVVALLGLVVPRSRTAQPAKR